MRHRGFVLILTMGAILSVTIIRAQETGAAQAQRDATELQMRVDIERSRPNLGAGDIARIARGYRIAPVRLNLNQKDAFLVGLGSYLVNATGGCNDCHTNPSYAAGGNPFMGQPKQVNTANYLAGGMPFGPFVSRNLTPDTGTGLPAGLTYAQFHETIRTGRDQKNVHPLVSPLLQ